MHQQCILSQTLRFLKGNQDTSRAPNNNKQPCSCQTSLRNLLFHLVQRISHFKSTDLYLFCTTKVFPKFLLPFQSQASFQSEQFGSLWLCSTVAVTGRVLFDKSAVAHAHAKKTPVGTIHYRRIKCWPPKKRTSSTRLRAKRYKFENNRRFRSKLLSANLLVTCAPASCSLAPQNPSQLHDNRSLMNKHWTFTLHHDRDANVQA